jgi:peptide/nickel transport system substrate-binding protein
VPAPAAAPTAAPAPGEQLPVRFAEVFASTAVPGGPKIDIAKVEKEKAAQLLLKYHANRQPLWTRAKYGGETISVTSLGGALSNPTLDPHKAGGRRNHYYGRLLYYDQGLCGWQGRDDDFSKCKGRYAEHNAVIIVPGLFLRWEQPDPVTYVFHVRKGALWPAIPPVNRTDREVTADDVKWYLDITKQEGILKLSFLEMKSVQVLDRYTVKVTTETPLPDFLRSIAQSGVGMFPKECYDAGKECMGQKLITPGPWLLKEYTLRQRVILEKNPEFFLKGLPYVDRWVWLHLPDPAAQKAAFVTGKVMNLRAFKEDEALIAVRQLPGSVLTLQVSAASGYGWRPKLEGPFADVRVRRALMLAIDMRSLWELGSDGLGVLATEFGRDLYGLGRSFFLTLDNGSEYYRFDPARAKKLLAEAGYADGFKTIATSSGAAQGTGYEYILGIQSMWKKHLNVDLSIKLVDAAALTTLITERKWEGIISSFTAGSWSDGTTGFATMVTGSPFNYQNVSDPVIDDLFAKARREIDPAKRAALLWQYEQHEMDKVYMIRLNHVWPFDVTHPAEINGATHSWDFYFSLGVAWLTMVDPSKVTWERTR